MAEHRAEGDHGDGDDEHDPEQAPELRHMMGMTAVARVPSVARVSLMARVLRMISMALETVVARMPVVVHVIVVGFVTGMFGVFAPSSCDCFSVLMPVSLISFHNRQSIPPRGILQW